MKKTPLQLKKGMVARLCSLSEHCSHESMEHLVNKLVIIFRTRYCDTCHHEHYYLYNEKSKSDFSGDLNIENFSKANTIKKG